MMKILMTKLWSFRLRANGRNIVDQQLPTLLDVTSVCRPCCMLLDVVVQSLKPVKLFSQQLPTFLLFRDRRSVAQQCWIRLHSSFNTVGATHAHYAWFTKTYGLYPFHDALEVPTMLGVVASVCTQPHCVYSTKCKFRFSQYLTVYKFLTSDWYMTSTLWGLRILHWSFSVH